MRLWPRPSRPNGRGTSLDLLVVGLGNPGREYAGNRHNVGWLVVDELARRHDASWRAKFDGRLAEIRIDGHKVALLKPETYMNDSGRSVQAAAQVLQGRTPHHPRRPRRGRPRARPAAGAAGRGARRAQRAALDRQAPRHARVPAPQGRCRATWPRRPAAARRLRALRLRTARGRRPARRRSGRRGRDARRRRARSGAARGQQQEIARADRHARQKSCTCSAIALQPVDLGLSPGV